MRVSIVAALAATVAAAPAAAQSGPYVGIEAGSLALRDNDVDYSADFSTSQSPATPGAPGAPTDIEFDDVFSTEYQKGHDLGLIAGYDFGWVRLELDVGHKRARLDRIDPDENTDLVIGAINGALNRSSASPDPGAPGLAPLNATAFAIDGRVSTYSAMVNGLVDIDVTRGFSIYGGLGYGLSRVSAFGESGGAKAWQRILGARYALSPRLDLGVKYRYFASGAVKLKDASRAFDGNPDRVTVTPPIGPAADVDQTTDLVLTPEIEGRFRARSWLASLIFKFGRASGTADD